MLKAILLDFNGVIINDEAIHQELIDELLLGENLRPSGAEFNQFCLGRSDRNCLQDILANRGRVATDEYIDQLIEKKGQAYLKKLETLNKLPIYDGVATFLEKVSLKDLKIGLVSGALRSEVELVLNRGNIARYFEVIVAGDEVTMGKPRPDGYLLAVERFNRLDLNLQLEPSNCLVIEDTPAGIKAAKAAGMQVVGVANTYPLHFMQRFANWAIDSLSELEWERLEANYAGVTLESSSNQ
ncbi:MAG: HAD family hydrolase [Microcystaceae cyanobacterium]